MPSYTKIGTFNPPLLIQELRDAVGIQDNTVGYRTIENGLEFIVPVSVTENDIDTVIAAHDETVLTEEQQAEDLQADTVNQVSAIPNWASWDETTALNWHDTNIAANLPVANLTEANAVLADLETENRALVRMVIAMRNKLWPHLQE